MSQIRGNIVSTRRCNRSKSVTEGVQNVGTFLSNLVSRVASQITRRNINHLVVPINELPRSKSSSPRSSGSPRKKRQIHLI